MRLRAKTTIALMAAVVTAAAAAPAARAGQCGKPDLVDMVPGDKATGVPLNATLGAHYTASTDYLGEEVVLVHPDMHEETLTATWDATEKLLSVTPTAPLAPSSDYTVRWPALRGLNAAAAGVGGNASFTTGAADDVAPPTFAGVTGVSWDLERTTDDCVDGLVERFIFDIALGPVSDDGGRGSLVLLLYQTMGPEVNGAPTPIPARAWPTEPMRAQVKLAKELAVGEICFAAVARDSVGGYSASNSVESCVHTTAPPFFNGCSVAGRGSNVAAIAATALLAFAARRRRPRTRR